MTYSPKTSAQAVTGGWKDFDRAPSKQEIYRRRVVADGIVEPKLSVADVAIEEIPNGSVVVAMFGNRKESFQKIDGQWEETGFHKSCDSQWIITCILKSNRAAEFTLNIPVGEWYRFQK